MKYLLTLSCIFFHCACCAFTSCFLQDLPPGFLPFEEFAKEFKLEEVSTEQLHPHTKTLSQTMYRDSVEGLGLLLDVDEKVIEGLELFIPSIKYLAPLLAERISQGGRLFMVGSGSSGRVAIDIAAKCGMAFLQFKEQIQGVIAGGDSAIVRAKEGFEDSESDGRKVLENENIGSKDTIILISASGSASFNVGCGHFAADKGAKVFYFYNSENIPLRTHRLFSRENNPVIPLCIDIGPQAIAGSTRLQGATLAETCLGSLLGTALYLCEGKMHLAEEYPQQLIQKIRKGNLILRNHLKDLGKFIEIEREIFSNQRSNFRQLKDRGDEGYVTFIASEDSMREVLIDSTETSPTFSTHPIRREGEWHKKRAEFRAYLVGRENNRAAWTTLLGRNIHITDEEDTDNFLLACEAKGLNSYQNRPLGKGNFLIGVAKVTEYQPISESLIHCLKEAKKTGGQVGMVVLCNKELSNEQLQNLNDIDIVLIMKDIPHDALGFTETIILKQALNLISNGSMTLMNKVHGNQMIDVRASNKKLIDRCMRLIKGIWSEYQPHLVPSDKDLYHYIAHVAAIKKVYEEKGIYTPSVVKIVLVMLYLKKSPESFEKVMAILNEKQEKIDWISAQVAE